MSQKIGIVLSQPPSYSETFFNSKIKGLISNGFDVTLFVEKNNNYKLCKVIESQRLPHNPILRTFKAVFKIFGLIFYCKRLQRFYSSEKSSGRTTSQVFKNIILNAHLLKADLDWLHFGFATLALQSENVALSIKAKMAISLRGYDICIYPLSHPNCYDLLWNRVNKVHVISNDLLELAYANGMSKETSYCKISPAINIKMFVPYDTGAANKVLNILTVGRLHWKKGYRHMVKALSMLKASKVKFKYKIIGEGLEYEQLKYLVSSLELEDEIEFIGSVPHKKVVEYLNECDIYIQYSVSEGFCNAVLEAQAMECLCIVSDAEGLSENVLHKKTGWVVAKNKHELLAYNLQELIQLDVNKKKQITKNARERVVRMFNLDIQQNKFIKFYE